MVVFKLLKHSRKCPRLMELAGGWLSASYLYESLLWVDSVNGMEDTYCSRATQYVSEPANSC